MEKGPRLVIQGAILGSFLIGSMSYFVSAGATTLNNQQTIPVHSQELSSSPTQPVKQENVPPDQPVSQNSISQALPVIANSAAQAQVRAATPTASATATAAPTKKQKTPANPKKQKPKCQVSSSYPDKILQWCSLITQYTNKYNLDANLIAAVILQESGGNPQAYSPSGAVGLMQIMPSDGLAAGFMCPAGPCFASRPTVQELQDPEFNINYGTRMLASLMDKYGNMRDALKAYGPGNSGYYYANKVLAIYDNYK
jgi:soluble lytic murein transglycosylase-like protein